MANLPANPGQALWIGSAAGKNHANIGIGQGTSGGVNHTDYPQSSIEANSSPPADPNKFFLNSDGNPVFRINASAGTTSTNTKHPRTECREVQPNGTSLAAWDGRTGDHYLKARCRVIQVTTNRPWVCFGQIHGSSSSPNTSDLIRLQTEGTNGTSTNLSLIARRTPPGGSEIRTVLRTGYNVGTWFDYEIRQTNGTITVKIDGVVVLTATGMGQIDNYFKYGCYLQDSIGEGAQSGDWGAVEFERGSVQVWHTGYPTPTTPVFTGGTDPGGGAGGGTGGVPDTQPPTTPANLTATPVPTGIQLDWDPSTDNVGVDHYNVYRSTGSTSTGGSGGTGDVDLSTAAGQLGWGAPLPSSDEFDYTGPPNPAKWSVYNSAGHAGNGLRSPNRVTVGNGRMTLTGLAGSANTAGMAHKLGQQYGRWEVRARSFYTNDPTVPGTDTGGYHPVLIVWPTSDRWPDDGEYDFLENGEPGEQAAGAFMHYPSTNSADQIEVPGYTVDLREFHNFAFEWAPDGVTGWVDGVQWFTYADKTDGSPSGSAQNIQAMPEGQLTVQLDAFQATGCLASTMELEWARVYTLTPGAPGGGTDTGGGATAATFGRTAAGPATTASSADKIIASKFTASAAGTLTEGHARAWLSATGSTTSRMLVYADSSGAPAAKLATSDEITITDTTSGSVQDYVFSGGAQIAITAGTSYWLALAWHDPGTPSLTYSRDSSSSTGRLERSDITYGTFPNPWGTSTGTFTGPIDVWVGTGTAGSGASTSSFGKQTNGASSSASTADKTAVSPFAATASGTLSAGHARAWLDSGSTNTKVVVYADSSGLPGAKLAESDVVVLSATSEAVVDYAFSGANRISITAGTTYWLGLAWQDPGTPSLNLSRDATASGRQEASAYAPNPFGTPSAQSGPVDVYVDVTSSGSTGGSGGGQVAQALIATTSASVTSYLDTNVVLPGGVTQGLGVGGIPTPAAGPNVVLVGSDSSSRLTLSTANRVVDGRGHKVAGITITADGVTVQNFVITGATHDAVNIFANNVTVQNCDIYGIADDGGGDINAITLFGDGIKILYNTCGVTDFLVSGPPNGSHTDFVQTWNTSSKRSTSNLIVQGNRVVGPPTSDERFIHQGFQGEGKGSTDGGGGGTGTSSGVLIADNSFEFDCVNQVINLLDIDNCSITRNTFAGSAAHIVGTGDGATGTVYYTDNVNTGTYGDIGVSTTAGPGPAGVVGGGGSGAPRYDYAVTAVDAAGNESGQASTNGTGGSADTVAPTVPTNVAASTNDGRITLTWNASTDDVGVARYAVRRGGVLRSYITAPTTRYVDIDLVNGVSYSYTVAALDAAGNASAQSSSVSATATGVPVTGAALLPGRLTGGKIQVQIAWGADLAADETTWTWSDVTTHVRQDPGISTALGRNDESSTSNPATLTVVLNNSSSDYSLGTISAHYPNVRRGTPVRVRIDPGDGVGGRIVFQGFADGFTPGWDSLKGTIPVVTLSASGTLRRLSQGAAPLQSVYRRVTTALPSVTAYWPMEEGKSSQFAYPVRGGSKFSYTGGQPGWGSDDSFDCSAALPTLANAYGQADVNAYTNTGTSQLRMLLSIPQSGLTDGTVLMHVEMTGTIHRWDLTYGITNGVESLGLYRYDAPKIPGTLNSSDIMAFKVNGIPGRLGLDWTQSGSNIIWTLSFTPATPTGANTATFVRKTLSGRTAGIVSHFEINPHNANIGATIGHITVENQITSFFADNDVLIAYAGETNTSSDGRLARLCAENGVGLQRYSAAPADVIPIDQMGPQLVAPLLDLLHECERSNQGQLWDGRSAGLSYTTRKRREDGTVKLTVNAALKQLAGDFQAVDDDQRNRNKVTVTRLHGATYTAEDVTGPLGTAAIGIYDDAVTVNVNDDDSIVHFANWFVMLGTVAGYRYPSVTVDLAASPTLAPAVLDIVPGERINVTNLDTTLAGFPDSTVSLIVEGIAHEITTRTWRATFRCSPYTPWATGLTGVVSGVTPAVVALIDAGIIDSSTIGADTVSGGGTPGGGGGSPATMIDATSVTFTDSGGLSSNYHVYGAGLPGTGSGLVVHLHGDAAFEHLNPTSNYAIAGNRGLTAVCKAKGYVFVSALAPDVTGTVTWWEAGNRNSTYFAELLDHLITTYQLDRSKVWLSGYSGGSVFITEAFLPLKSAKITGGGALLRGGGDVPAETVTPFTAGLKAAFPMTWITGGQDDGTYADDNYNALAAATAGQTYYSGQGFTATRLAPPGIDHEIDGAFGPQLDDVLPAMSGFSPPSRVPGSVRPTLTTSYLVTDATTGTTTTTSFTPAAGEVIVVKCWNADLDSPNIDTVSGGGLTYATKIHIQATSKAEAWIFVAEVGPTSPGSMTVSTSWFGSSGQHGMIVERWASGLVAGVPAQSSPVMGTGAPSATITPTNANSVLTWICTDWNATAGTATYRTSATQTQTSSTSNVRAYAAYQNTPSTAAQTVGLSAPSGQAWALGAIELLPAH